MVVHETRDIESIQNVGAQYSGGSFMSKKGLPCRRKREILHKQLWKVGVGAPCAL